MGESFATPSQDAPNNVLPQPTLSAVTDDDDDEPPSSSYPYRQAEIEEEQAGAVDNKSSSNAGGKDHPIQDVLLARRKSDVSTDLGKVDTETTICTGVSSLRRWKTHRFHFPKLSDSARLRVLFTPQRPLGPCPTCTASFWAALRYTPLNVCLVFIPVSWTLHFTHQSPTLVFVFSALGIIPLAALLGLGTEQIALRTSQSVGGLLNATLGNIVEMIIAGIALKQCKLDVVQSSLLGGLLSNLLLVLGCAFIVGGFRFHQQEFQPMVAQLNSSLLIVSVISLIVPVAFHGYLENRLEPGTEVDVLLELSRGSAIILILIYIAYLFFQFYSHNHLFLDTFQSYDVSSRSSHSSSHRSAHTLPLPTTTSCNPCLSSSETEHLKMNTSSALLLLSVTTAFAYVTAEHLVDSLEGLVAAHPNISKEWITLIIIPVISNAAEHTTAVIVASKGKFDLAMSVAVGSCIQIALFVIPVLVLVAWGMSKPLMMLFDPLETVVLFLSVLLVKFSVEDGKSHWMSGLVLIAAYILIALSFWNFPESAKMLQGQPLLCV